MRWIDATWILGLGGGARLSQTGLAFAVTPDNEIQLVAGGEPLTITVTDPADLAGTTVFSPADLAAGPVALAAPGVGDAPVVGQPVAARPALWAYDGTGILPERAWQWRVDGIDVPGATGATYTPTAGEAGGGLSVVETASDGSGARSLASAELTVAS